MERLAGPAELVLYHCMEPSLHQKKLFDAARFQWENSTRTGTRPTCSTGSVIGCGHCKKRRCITTSSRTAASCTGLSGGWGRRCGNAGAGRLRWNTRCAVSRSPPATAHWAASFCKGRLGGGASGAQTGERQADRIIDQLLRVPGYRTSEQRWRCSACRPTPHLALKIRGGGRGIYGRL